MEDQAREGDSDDDVAGDKKGDFEAAFYKNDELRRKNKMFDIDEMEHKILLKKERKE